eukprot:TRINITY_DN3053_c0_g1_i1.p1 TRINITY_DN3053_c0_g1~~TRINITY_DN3053_c0_g1_i1.p1  ORF type:complete len:307 (+),score=108.04 TRINITY_DN3053_c0_g1_i1:502-1422(+)
MCEGTHHLLVSVEDGLIIRFGDTTEQLAPGDEVFVPAGHTYDVMARSSCRYVFGVQHRLLPSVPLSFLEETWGPPPAAPRGLVLPWMGFAVERPKFRTCLVLRDVPPFGPAGRAGLQDGDELLAIAGVPVPDAESYRRVVRVAVDVGLTLSVSVKRRGPDGSSRPFAVELKVEAKEKEPPVGLGPVPVVGDLTDAEALVADKPRLGKIARTLFPRVDVDDCHTVSKSEFLAFLPTWLAPGLLAAVEQIELLKAFSKGDKDRTGYLMVADFPLALHSVLTAILPAKEADEPAPKSVAKPKDPIPRPG